MLRYLIILCLTAGGLDARKKLDLDSDDGKIVGGRVIDIKDAPHQVSLLSNGYHICGGSIISTKYILTAAHCVEGKPHHVFSIRVASSIRNYFGDTINVKAVHEHPDYNSDTMDYDIALLELERSIPLSDNAKIIKLQSGPLSVGALVTVTGWGRTTENGQTSTNLRAVNVPVVSTRECGRRLPNPITPRMFCAGFAAGGKDSCQGDSGGPATYNGKLAGIVSWGSGCAKPERYGVYTRVSSLLNWIYSISGVTP